MSRARSAEDEGSSVIDFVEQRHEALVDRAALEPFVHQHTSEMQHRAREPFRALCRAGDCHRLEEDRVRGDAVAGVVLGVSESSEQARGRVGIVATLVSETKRV
jgi:hypothetical protein